MSQIQLPLLVICGPTASGKTAWAMQLAKRYPLEIISADSRQVYRRMDIGTAKATVEEQTEIPHHMIDLIDPDQEFSVADFVDRTRPLIEEINRAGKLPCVVGGTGLYIKALLGGLAPLPSADEALRAALHRRESSTGVGTLHQELQKIDPISAAAIHPNNLIRIVRALEVYHLAGRKMSELHAGHRFAEQPYRVMQLAPQMERDQLYRKIDSRAKQMLADGLIAETEGLVAAYSAKLKALQTLGYREVLGFLAGDLDYAQMLDKIAQHTRQYAKRQLTWFRKESEIIWVDSSTESGKVLRSIDKLLLL
jgi:tRNA dimethylallyltransferase